MTNNELCWNGKALTDGITIDHVKKLLVVLIVGVSQHFQYWISSLWTIEDLSVGALVFSLL